VWHVELAFNCHFTSHLEPIAVGRLQVQSQTKFIMNHEPHHFVHLEMHRGFNVGRTTTGLIVYLHEGFSFVEYFRDRGYIFLRCEVQDCPGRGAIFPPNDYSNVFSESYCHTHDARYPAF
jgi:hypothetical protein